jgi:hypothetical protein
VRPEGAYHLWRTVLPRESSKFFCRRQSREMRFSGICPDINESKFIWRYSFMASTIVLTMVNLEGDDLIDRLSKGRIDPCNMKRLSKELTQLLVAGLSAMNDV